MGDWGERKTRAGERIGAREEGKTNRGEGRGEGQVWGGHGRRRP